MLFRSHDQVGLRGLWRRIKREAPLYARLLPELPRLIHHNLEQGNQGLRRDLRAILQEQRRTNRTLSAVLWLGLGFALGVAAAHLVFKLHDLGVW